MFPCPACGKPTKVTQDERFRICSLCRKVSLASQCTEANAPKLRRRPATDDDVGANDMAFGWLDKEAAPPTHPCSNCGKETKAYHDPGKRVCRPCGLIQ